MNWKFTDNGNGQTAVYHEGSMTAACFVPQQHPSHDNVVKYMLDAFNTIEQCDKMPSELLAQNEILSDVVSEYEKVAGKVKDILSERDSALSILKQFLSEFPEKEIEGSFYNKNSVRFQAEQLINKIENGTDRGN